METEVERSMVYCHTDDHGNIEAVIGLKRDWLLYDIKNNAYVEGHVMSPENKEQRHMVQDVGEEGNVNKALRAIDLAVTQCKEWLYPFTKNDISTFELNNVLNQEQSSYGIVMSLPTDFSQTTLNLLAKLIHEYVVRYTVADWLSTTLPDKAETWAAKAAEMELQIKTCIHSRRKRQHRRLSVFP